MNDSEPHQKLARRRAQVRKAQETHRKGNTQYIEQLETVRKQLHTLITATQSETQILATQNQLLTMALSENALVCTCQNSPHSYPADQGVYSEPGAKSQQTIIENQFAGHDTYSLAATSRLNTESMPLLGTANNTWLRKDHLLMNTAASFDWGSDGHAIELQDNPQSLLSPSQGQMGNVCLYDHDAACSVLDPVLATFSAPHTNGLVPVGVGEYFYQDSDFAWDSIIALGQNLNNTPTTR